MTSTLVSASSTSFDTGKGTAGPIMSVRSSPLGNSGDSFGKSDSQCDARRLEILRTHRAVGVAYSPEELRIAQILRRDVVQTVALLQRDFLNERKLFRRRQE